MESLEDLVVFVRVVEKGSFTAGARDLQMSTSAVSKHIRRLESALSIKLLNRSTHGMALTDAGTAYFQHCTRVIAELEQARATASALSEGVKGKLRIHSTPGVGQRLVAPAVVDFMDTYSAVSVELVIGQITMNLMKHAVDIMICTRDIAKESDFHAGLTTRVLGSAPYVICASPDYLRRKGAPSTPRELTEHNCLIHTTQGTRPQEWRFGSKGAGFTVTVSGSFRSNLEAAVLRATLGGAGIARLPEYTARRELAAGGLQSLFDGEVRSDRAIKAFYARTKFLPSKVRAFLDFLADRLKKPPGPWVAQRSD